jgi:hypothetical protein
LGRTSQPTPCHRGSGERCWVSFSSLLEGLPAVNGRLVAPQDVRGCGLVGPGAGRRRTGVAGAVMEGCHGGVQDVSFRLLADGGRRLARRRRGALTGTFSVLRNVTTNRNPSLLVLVGFPVAALLGALPGVLGVATGQGGRLVARMAGPPGPHHGGRGGPPPGSRTPGRPCVGAPGMKAGQAHGPSLVAEDRCSGRTEVEASVEVVGFLGAGRGGPPRAEAHENLSPPTAPGWRRHGAAGPAPTRVRPLPRAGPAPPIAP